MAAPPAVGTKLSYIPEPQERVSRFLSEAWIWMDTIWWYHTIGAVEQLRAIFLYHTTMMQCVKKQRDGLVVVQNLI